MRELATLPVLTLEGALADMGIEYGKTMSSLIRGGDGVPYHILLRGVLESRTMADAIRRAVGHPRVSSGNFLLVDAGGEAIDLEAVPGDFGYLLPQQGMIAHSNHFLTSVPVFDRRKAFSALTLLRPERARHLPADVVDARNVAVDDVRTVFRVAEGPPCEHDYVSVTLDALFSKEVAGQRIY